MKFTLIKTQYYSEIDIPDHLGGLRLDHRQLLSEPENVQDYFEICPGKKPLTYIIKEYKTNVILKAYQYNARGNLVWMKLYDVGRKNRVIKWIYDYSHSEKRLKEKRYYTSNHVYIKKELFSQGGHLKSMIFYLEGSPYYKETFDEKGQLLGSIYYQENGLKVP